MTVYYSASTNGFYPDFMVEDYDKKGNLPGDIVMITDKQHKDLIEGQSYDREIIPDKNGMPMLQPVQRDNQNEQVDASK